MSQKARMVQMLTDAGAAGVTSRQFNDAQIFRYSARIEELRKAGHLISTERVKGTLFRFILRAVSPSSLGGPNTATGVSPQAAMRPRQEPEQAAGDLTSPVASPLLSGNGSEVEMNSPLECASVAVTSSQAEADGSAIQGVAEPLKECDAVETPVSLSLFEVDRSPYGAEAT